MGKLKWNYDKQYDEYYTLSKDNNEYIYDIIKCGRNAWCLEVQYANSTTMLEHTFSKLKNAKLVAELLENG